MISPIQKPAASGNYQTGRASPITRVTMHHIVGDATAAIARFQTPGVEVSATYVVGSGGQLYQCVREGDTSYCDGNFDSNSRTISIEHAGGLPELPYTEAMYKTSIELCRYLIKKYGISDFKRHRDVIDRSRYPGGTACPGSLDVERIVREATKEEDMADLANDGDVVNIYHECLGMDRVVTKAEIKAFSGRPKADVYHNCLSSDEYKEHLARLGGEAQHKLDAIKSLLG